MQAYVAGLMFSLDKTKVALIQKNKPKWQNGLLNGIGGKVEPGEHPDKAMIREFKEETGVDHTEWKKFCVLIDEGEWVVHFYKAFTDDVHNVKTTTDEVVTVYDVKAMKKLKTISNIPWLVLMALDEDVKAAGAFYNNVAF